MIRTTLLTLLASTSIAVSAPIVPSSYTLNSGVGSYGDDTGSQLTDGLYNDIIPEVSLGTPDSFNWVGWSGNNPSITFDFGQVVTIESLQLSTVKWTHAAVYLPTSVTIASDVVGVTDNYDNQHKVELGFTGSWTGSTLTIELQSGGQWTFLDEVTFNGYVGAPASNSVPDSGSMFVLVGGALLALHLHRRRA